MFRGNYGVKWGVFTWFFSSSEALCCRYSVPIIADLVQTWSKLLRLEKFTERKCSNKHIPFVRNCRCVLILKSLNVNRCQRFLRALLSLVAWTVHINVLGVSGDSAWSRCFLQWTDITPPPPRPLLIHFSHLELHCRCQIAKLSFLWESVFYYDCIDLIQSVKFEFYFLAARWIKSVTVFQ